MKTEQTYETPGPIRLNLDLPFGRVEVETASADRTEIELEGSGDSRQARELIESARVELVERGDGHEVVVHVRTFGFFVSIGRGLDLRLRVRCPEGADLEVRTKSADVRAAGRYGSASVQTASGDVRVDDVQGDLRIKSASGDLHLESVGGKTHVQTASGDLWLGRAGGDVVGQLVSGDVLIREADGSVTLNTVSGDQRVEAVTAGSVELHAVSGDIRVGVRRGSRVYVDANTVSGTTSSELELSDAPASAPSGDGPQIDLRAKTISGDIGIARAAAPSQLPAM